MTKFQPVVLEKKGAENVVATTPAELVNAQARGYRKAPPAEKPKPPRPQS